MGESDDLVEAFVADLRQLRQDVGQPSFRSLEVHARKAGSHLPASTASDVVRGRRLPKLPAVIAFVLACRHYAEECKIPVPARAREMYSWQEAHKTASLTLEVTAPVGAGDVTGPPLTNQQRLQPGHGKNFWIPERQRCSYLLIGCSDVAGLPPLAGVPRDCQRMTEALQSAAPWMSLTTLFNPTNQQAHQAVRRTFMAPSELVVLHVVGHGFLNESARLSLPLSDSQEDNLLQTSLDLEGLLAQASQQSRERAVVLIVDTSYAGAVIPNAPPELEHWCVVAATGAHGQAVDGEGSFTGVLSRTLSEGVAACPFPMLTVTDLAREVRKVVLERSSYRARLPLHLGGNGYGIGGPQHVTWGSTQSMETLALAFNRAA
ncbi:caspase family protein [Streptomyces sp. NPDC003032]